MTKLTDEFRKRGLGTPYPQVAARLAELFDREPLSGGTLVVDETGVGRPVVDLLRTLPIKASTYPLTITSGSRARVDEHGAGGCRRNCSSRTCSDS
jgi:hypothetical protein